jgi:hypothetical protein
MAGADVVTAIARDERDFLISDGGLWFPISALHGPVGAERLDDPAAQVLRDFIADPGGALEVEATGWRVLARTPRHVLFQRGDAEYQELVEVERTSSGEWEWVGSAYKEGPFHAVRDRNEASAWRLDPAADPPAASSTSLDVLVTEIHCASGRSAEGRIEAPDVYLSDSQVRLVAYVTRLRGSQKCPGNPETPAVFVLPEPLGERELVDAGNYPTDGSSRT